ncbi:MAG: hypothetical protein PHD54_13100, partial [Desulfuromonadaceae bacterium]|nr:hypothetical protein [Desulfuromonadaceae bacterium]
MARSKLVSNANKLKKGLGQGHGENYRPFLTVRDVPSRGLSHRIKGYKSNRVPLVIWQYLNAKYELEKSGKFTKNFLLVAPGLIVYERLLDAYLG